MTCQYTEPPALHFFQHMAHLKIYLPNVVGRLVPEKTSGNTARQVYIICETLLNVTVAQRSKALSS
ncbi:hypothetical protein NQ317_010685 [Molorchus minor]|uniref:Uncharacterized protein n=1 Tax=Molorchus minor TaxID=1323400 RepID=A0ABQ9K8H2_9CUCU|nr:hypothetical protein NQ317_010685 [Molorchus minor]